MRSPFFSVVIPTKNRSFFIRKAIFSVLEQSFPDVEVVVADNDDTEETRSVMDGIKDSRIRYFRTGGLSMPDNWDFGSREAKGEYIMFLEDRQLLKTRALEKICVIVKENNYPLVVSWCCDRILDHKKPVKIVKAGETGTHFLISSDEVIEDFLNYGRRGRMKNILPRGLNSCIHHLLVEQIRNNTPDGRLCLPVAPDYTLVFLQLAFIEDLLHIDEAMVVTHGYKYSNGMNFMLKKDPSLKYIGEVGGESAYYDRVPIKAPIIANCLFNDFEKIRSLVGGRLSKYPINAYNYFFQCYQDIQDLKSLGVDTSIEEAEWEKALATQEKSIQDASLVVRNSLDKKDMELLCERQRTEKFKIKVKERDERITNLDAKVSALEDIIHRKEEKIRKLDKKIETLYNKIQQERERADKIKLKLNKMSGNKQ